MGGLHKLPSQSQNIHAPQCLSTAEPDDKDKKDKSKEADEISAEDQALLEGLQLAVERVQDKDAGVQKMALEHLRKEIRAATSSMTSVPKPLKFLRPHYTTLTDVYANAAIYPVGSENRKLLGDVLAVLAMTMATPGSRESLRFKLESNAQDLGSWGHEFVRSLAGEIGEEYVSRTTADAPQPVEDLLALVKDIVPFHIQHNAFAEAVDLLLEVQRLPQLLELTSVDEANYQRICLYLLRCADFMADPDDLQEMLVTAYELYRKQGSYADALRVAIKLNNDMARINQLFEQVSDETQKKQLAFMVGRSHVNLQYEGEEADAEEVNELVGNSKLSEHYLLLAKDLDVLDPKTPEDIFKSHLAETGGFSRRREGAGAHHVDSARANLASTFVNAFVNLGYQKDALVTPEGNAWLYKNKDHGMMSAAASIGAILLWNVEEGLNQIDKFMHSQEDHIRAGALLAIGIVSSGVRIEHDAALALLSEHLESASKPVRYAAAFGLGLAYAGSNREDLIELLAPLVADADAGITEVALAALSLGMIFVGTTNSEVASLLVQRLMESADADLDNPMARFLVLGLALPFLGQMEKADAMLEAVKTVEHKMGRSAAVVLETAAYAGSGNVLKVQKMLHLCAEHLQEDADHQSVAVLGIALITLGEEVGAEMALRSFDHLLHYGELPIRRAVPLAFALLNVSNPDYGIIDQLSRLTHDQDGQVAQNAVLALGVIGCGTNNSRIAGLLRQLAEFYSREASHLFVVRVAQGFLHAGKGLVSMTPFHSDRLLASGVGLAGILTLLHAALDMKNTVLDKHHYLLFSALVAMNPRMLITLDEDLNPLPVTVRVGQAVETVGQAGRPKTITGFQTHTTPVLLGVKDRAELASSEYLAYTSVLEGVVILRKNPEAEGAPEGDGGEKQ
jgi:26S proteasome regulatory subunit N1